MKTRYIGSIQGEAHSYCRSIKGRQESEELAAKKKSSTIAVNSQDKTELPKTTETKSGDEYSAGDYDDEEVQEKSKSLLPDFSDP